MTLDPRTPVLVGVGQLRRRPSSPEDATEPVAMAAEAVRIAGGDSGAGGRLVRRADSIRFVSTMTWRYRAPASLVAAELGASPRQTLVSATGGNAPQALLDDAAAAILRGELDVAVVCGAEAMYSRRQARKWEVELPWTSEDAAAAGDDVFGDERSGSHDAELAAGVVLPSHVYPLFENAIRAARGETVAEHRERVARLWARFSEVATTNPFAWSPSALTPDEVGTPSPTNRMIAFPYPKLMNANLQVDQAAALLLCSVEAARSAGVPEDRWVFPWCGAEANDHWFVSERDTLAASPAIAAIGGALFRTAAIDADDVGHVDLYSCFPSAVQLGAAALGLPLDDPARPLTVTGGLTFGGGPGNDYVTHSIAAMADRLRQDPGSVGLVTALGWYATKHAAGLYSTTPPSSPFRVDHVQAEVDALPRRDVALGSDAAGDATVETYTVVHDRDGAPERGIVVALLPDGRRAWGVTSDGPATSALLGDDPIGRPCRLDGAGGIAL